MKKNIATIIIIALAAINVVLTGIIMFVMLPSQSKVNSLVTNLATMVELELESPDADENKTVGLADRDNYIISEPINITLKAGADGKLHYVGIDTITVTTNKTADDYKTVSAALESNAEYIKQIVQNCYSSYALTDATNKTEEIRTKVLAEINRHFAVENVVIDIAFGNLRFQ